MRILAFLLLTLFSVSGCSIRKMAINSVADSLSESSDVYSSDDDPELIRYATPFALKTMESLLQQVPRHRGLLVSASAGFTQYAYAFVWLDAEEVQNTDPEKARRLRDRATNLYLRARDYGMRALHEYEKDFEQRLQNDPRQVLSELEAEAVPALYWTAVSWAAAVSQDKGNMDLVADLPMVDAMLKRALELQEDYEQGAIHEFFISYEASRSGGSLEQAKKHYERAMVLNNNQKVSPVVAYAENISVANQDHKEFLQLLERALEFDVDKAPANRMANLIAKKRARQLKSQAEDLFLDSGEEETNEN